MKYSLYLSGTNNLNKQSLLKRKGTQVSYQYLRSNLGVKVIMDTSYGGNLTNVPLLRKLRPKALGCTLTQIIAPSTDKMYSKECD